MFCCDRQQLALFRDNTELVDVFPATRSPQGLQIAFSVSRCFLSWTRREASSLSPSAARESPGIPARVYRITHQHGERLCLFPQCRDAGFRWVANSRKYLSCTSRCSLTAKSAWIAPRMSPLQFAITSSIAWSVSNGIGISPSARSIRAAVWGETYDG